MKILIIAILVIALFPSSSFSILSTEPPKLAPNFNEVATGAGVLYFCQNINRWRVQRGEKRNDILACLFYINGLREGLILGGDHRRECGDDAVIKAAQVSNMEFINMVLRYIKANPKETKDHTLLIIKNVLYQSFC